MMEYLRRQRLQAAKEIEIAENKLQHISQDDQQTYDQWTAELFVAQRKHRSIVVMAKRQEREETRAARIRAAKSEPGVLQPA